MDLKNLKTQVTYRIEPKPGGGFIARATDPAVPSIEAPTREELQEKIRAQAFEKLGAEFPALKRLERQLETAGALSSKHAGAFILRSMGNETVVTEVSTPEQKVELAKELRALMNKSLPELSQALAASADKTKTSSTEEEGGRNPGLKGTKLDSTSVANTPIVPEASSRWPLVAVVLVILGSLLYFAFLHR